MPDRSPTASLERVRRRLGWAVRDRFPHRKVVRTIQGVTMTLPWSHRLPDYTRGDSPYGQNLVQLVHGLAERSEQPVTMIDVGANVGDSTLQVLAAVPDAAVVCVEADDAYLDFLRINVGDDPRCAIEPSLLVPADTAGGSVEAVRTGGTTRFVTSGTGTAIPRVTPAELRERYASTGRLRVVKSDTDGYDVVLVPALAREFVDLRPVLFFELDPRLSRVAGHPPEAVWPELAALGYAEVAVWDNGGAPLFRAAVDDLPALARSLDEDPALRDRQAYWDVAVVHRDDTAARAVIAGLVAPER